MSDDSAVGSERERSRRCRRRAPGIPWRTHGTAGAGSGVGAAKAGRASAVARIIGDNRDNILFGTDADDHIEGRGGDDRLFGLTGNDILDGGSGNDILDGGSGGDSLLGDTFFEISHSARGGDDSAATRAATSLE